MSSSESEQATALEWDRAVVELFAAEYTSLLRLAVLVLDDRVAAEDAVQDAFVQLYHSYHRIDDHDAAPAYLRSIVLNTSRSRLRRLRVASKHRLPATPDVRSPEEHSIRSENDRELVAALATLPRRQRECIVLRYYLDLSGREIAQTLNISEGSVKSHTSRGMSALAAAMGARR